MKNTEHSSGKRRDTSKTEVSKHKRALTESRVPLDNRVQKSEKSVDDSIDRTRKHMSDQDMIDRKEHEQKLAKVITEAKEYIKQKDLEHAREISRLKEEIESLTLQAEEASSEDLTQKAIFDIASLSTQERVELAKIQGYLERQKDIEVAKFREDNELDKKLEISLLQEETEREKIDALSKLKEEAEKDKNVAISKIREEAEKDKNAAISKIREEAEKDKNAAISKIREEAEEEKRAAISMVKGEAEKRINSKFSKLREEKEKEKTAELVKLKKEFEREKKVELEKLKEDAQKGFLDEISKTEKTISEYREALAEIEYKYERLKIKNEQLLHIYSDKIIKWELEKGDAEGIIQRPKKELEPRERPEISSERKVEQGISSERKIGQGTSAERKVEQGTSSERKVEQEISSERKVEQGTLSEHKKAQEISSRSKGERERSAEHTEEPKFSSKFVGERKVLSEKKTEINTLESERREPTAVTSTAEKVGQKPKNLFFDLVSTLILVSANLLFIFVVYPNITAWIDYVGLNNLTLLIRILLTMLGAMVSLFCYAKTREFSAKRAAKNPLKKRKKQSHSIKFLIGTVAVGVALLGVFLFSSIFLFFLIGTALIILASLLVPDYS